MADAEKLIAEWPSLARANAETLFRSPAWRMTVKCAGEERTLRVLTDASAPETGELVLAVTVGDERHFLGLRDAEAYPDLHRLWTSRAGLDRNLILALVERECGTVFEIVESATRREFAVIGLAEPEESSGARTVFGIDGLSFSLDVTPALMVVFGRLDCIDPTHEAVRSLTRPARYRYASVEIPADATLAEGDALVTTGSEANDWLVEPPDDERAHVCAAEESEIAFASFADGAMPRPADDGRLVLVRGGRIVADGEFSRIGDVTCFRLTHLRS